MSFKGLSSEETGLGEGHNKASEMGEVIAYAILLVNVILPTIFHVITIAKMY